MLLNAVFPLGEGVHVNVKAEYLHSFCVAAREGSITAAASTLGLSQPAVSRHLLLLQEAHGAPLYERSAHGITLTPAGHVLLPYACSVSQALTQARRFLQGEVEQEMPRLRIGLSHHLTTRYTGPLLRASKLYNDTGSLLRLHLLEAYSDDLAEALAKGNLDVAYVLGEANELGEEVRVRRVSEERVMLLVKGDDPLGAQPYQPLSVLEGETLVVPSSVSSVYRRVLQALRAARVRPGRMLEVSGPAAVRSAILDGLGIGATLESFVRPEVASGALRLVEVEVPGMTMGVRKLMRSESHLFPGERQGLAFLAEHLGERSRWD